MSITDELRKWGYGFCGDTHDVVTAIADRIDAEHEAMLADVRKTVYQGLIELPKDADGEYIHIGDMMEGVDKYDSLKEVMGEVTTISFDATFDPDDSRSVGIRVWSDDRRSYHTAYLDPRASVYRHYHAPTVEDVLTEMFAKAIERGELTNGAAQTIAEYATKLRLAEGEDA